MKSIARGNKNDILIRYGRKITRIIFRNFYVCVSVRENQCLISICVYVPPFIDDSLISNVRNNVFESCLSSIQFQMAE